MMRFLQFKSASRHRALHLVLLTAVLALSAAALQAGAEAVPVKRETPEIHFDQPGFGSGTATSIEAEMRSASFNPVKITMSPIPFETISPNGFIVREVVVQNDSPAPATVSIRLRYTDRDYSTTLSRSVSTTRQVPAHSRQTIPFFVPASLIRRNEYSSTDYFNSANPQIFLNGFPYRPLPTGFMEGENTDINVLPLPSSFAGQQSVADFLALAITRKHDSLFINDRDTTVSRASARSDGVEPVISGPDTIQWPAIPQFYQSQKFIFRKTNDQFSPDAERAIRDAVMLGSTEVLLVTPGSPWPEWAPRPVAPGLPSVVARGFGQSVVIDASSIGDMMRPQATSAGTAPGMPPAQFFMKDPEDGMPGMGAAELVRPDPHEKERIVQMLLMSNPALETTLREARIRAFDPSQMLLALPHVGIPAIPFFLVIIALLAYIVIVGPVNYFRLIKKKKSILLLLLTVPLISLAFVAIVIVFVGIVEGWSSRASAVGVTFLDQKESMAYTRAAVNLYAPVPVRSLVFDTADSVTFSATTDVDISLGRDQIITGANRARVPLAYAISRAEKHLEQIKVVHDASGVSVVNGLGVPLTKLMVKADDGGIWVADSTVAPGESVRLSRSSVKVPTKEEFDHSFASLLDKYTGFQDFNLNPNKAGFPFNPLLTTASALLLEMPVSLSEDKREDLVPRKLYGIEPEGYVLHDLPVAKEFFEKPGMLEAVLPSGMYMAETDRPLFYSPGCEPVSFRARHIVFGAFTAQEATTNEN